jgi:hypothetical protein
MTMMRIQSQIDTVILSLGSAPTLRRVDPYLQGCSAYAFLAVKRRPNERLRLAMKKSMSVRSPLVLLVAVAHYR